MDELMGRTQHYRAEPKRKTRDVPTLTNLCSQHPPRIIFVADYTKISQADQELSATTYLPILSPMHPGVTGPQLKWKKLITRILKVGDPEELSKIYRVRQKELIDKGLMYEAVQMDVDDVKGKFPGKYDKAIDEMLAVLESMRQDWYNG